MAKYRQPWMNTAYSRLGVKETPGPRNNATIMQWAEVTGLRKVYTADSIPWCGLFVAFIMAQNGLEPVKDPLWAQNWNKYGTKLSEPAFGAIMVFVRDGGGHVGFYVSEDDYNYHILGGNQSDMVSITKVSKSRCIGYRWPPGMDKFYEKGRIRRTLSGTVSSNEA